MSKSRSTRTVRGWSKHLANPPLAEVDDREVTVVDDGLDRKFTKWWQCRCCARVWTSHTPAFLDAIPFDRSGLAKIIEHENRQAESFETLAKWRRSDRRSMRAQKKPAVPAENFRFSVSTRRRSEPVSQPGSVGLGGVHQVIVTSGFWAALARTVGVAVGRGPDIIHPSQCPGLRNVAPNKRVLDCDGIARNQIGIGAAELSCKERQHSHGQDDRG